MSRRIPKRALAFIVPTLNELAAQNEDIVQLLLFAAVRLAEEADQKETNNFTATILSVEPDLRGWDYLSSLFSKDVVENITVATLKEPATPNLAIASHKPAYQLFEYLKDQSFDEVHCLDRQGLVYYATQAKQLGLYCLNTLFAVHIVGGILFDYEVEDRLLEDVGALMDDLLERGSVERADVIYVHDTKAWTWYRDKIKTHSADRIYPLAWPNPKPQPVSDRPIAMSVVSKQPAAIVYYGALSAIGLPMFCDALDRLIPTLEQSVEIFFVGSPQAMGGMDAVSYIRLRSTKWGVPVTIKRDLSIADEIAFLYTLHSMKLNSMIVCNTVRSESLRARLIVGSGLPVLQIERTVDADGSDWPVCIANPNQIAKRLAHMLTVETHKQVVHPQILADLWYLGRSPLKFNRNVYTSSPLMLRHTGGPKVSVCVTHFRRPQKLRTALASLKAQTYQNFEVIVIDDGSPEPEIQSELSKIREEIQPLGWRLLVQENRYLGAARNYGASQASGDYLLFMDDDNVAKANELSTLVAVALRTGSDIVTSFFDTFETEACLTSDEPPALRFTPFGSDATLGILTNCYGDANALYSRTIFHQVGGFTEDYGITHEDWEFFCRAALEGAKLICVPESLFWYRVDQGGMFRNQNTQLHKNANLRRHIRPYLAKLPHYQANLVQLAQGLTTELPLVTVSAHTRAAGSIRLQPWQQHVPYARVAVIMRTKDRPLLLRRGIQSVLDQTFKDWLLVIVNDGGMVESTNLVVEQVAAELAGRVLVLHHPVSLGMQTAANAGISRCDSDFIVIHDDDDSWHPTFLARTVSHLDEQGWNPKVGGVVTWSQVIVEELSIDGEIKQRNQFVFNDKLRTIGLLELAGENRFPPISFLFHRAAFDVIGSFKEQYSVLGDWDFHLRLLCKYNIDVIAEPLANYHHRTQGTSGAYGNSVHAQSALHQAKRTELYNSVLRTELSENEGISLAQLMVLGDLQKTLTEQQSKEFQQLNNYLWTIEQRVTYVADQVYNVNSTKVGRNLVRNGDFRYWTDPSPTVQVIGARYAYAEVCPGLILCYDGHRVAYQVERRKVNTLNGSMPLGKTYLHLENKGTTKGGTWFRLEWSIPAIKQLSGQTICISGYGRLAGTRNWLGVSGRYCLGDGRELFWPEQFVTVSSDFSWWHCLIKCPAVQETELMSGHQTRIMLHLPYDQPFELDITNIQIELGVMPTEFEYNGRFSLSERLSQMWNKGAIWMKQSFNSWAILSRLSSPQRAAQAVEIDV